MLAALFISASLFITQIIGQTIGTEKRDVTVCSPELKEFENENNYSNLQMCVVLFGKGNEKNWEEADQQCRDRNSFLLDLNKDYYNSTELVNFLELRNDLDLIWIGMRRVSGFYFWKSTNPSAFRITTFESWGNKWSDESEPAPDLDCVALDTKKGTLVTKNCSHSLPYMCMNNGFSTKFINSTLCPQNWSFTYLLDSEGSGCFRIFTPQNLSNALEACKRENSSMISAKDYHGVYKILQAHYVKPNIKAYWVNERRNETKDSCTVRAKTAPPARMTWSKHNCSDMLPFICKRPVDDIRDLNVSITPSRKNMSEVDYLTCKVNINGVTGSDEEEALHFQWIKDGVPVNVNNSYLSPTTTLDETKEFGELVSRQGSYQCRVLIAGHTDYVSSEEVDVFRPDVSTYVLTLKGQNVSYTDSQDFSRLEFHFTITFIKSLIGGFVNETKHKFGSAEWDFRRMTVNGSMVTFQILLFITWNATSGNPRKSNEEMNVYRPLCKILQNYETDYFPVLGIEEGKLVSADTCFEETMNVSSTKQIRWPEAQGTTNVVSHPSCFDDQGQKITRICKASLKGAHWMPLPHSFTCNDDPSKEYCSESRTPSKVDTFSFLSWPETRNGVIALPEPLCLTDKLQPVVRRCLRNSSGFSYWDSVNGICSNDKLSYLTVNLQNLSETEIDGDNVLESTQLLYNLTSGPAALQPLDIHYIATTLENIANSPYKDDKVVQTAARAFDNVMSMNPDVIEDMQGRLNSSSRITDSLERIVSTAALQGENGTLRVIGRSLILETWNLTGRYGTLPTGIVARSSQDEEIETLLNGTGIPPGNIEAGIALPMDLVAEYARTDSKSATSHRLSFIIYKNVSLFEYGGSENNLKANSFVIHAHLGKGKIRDLPRPIRMIFKFLNDSKDANMSCGYWEQSLNNSLGGWSTDGCYLRHKGSYFCECDHLTNFALLLSVDPGYSIPEEHDFALQIITYIGCGLSIFGLAMTVLTYLLFRKWRKGNKHQALVNLSTALMIVLVTFVLGINRKEPKIGCIIVAVILHYFLLASFAWMLVEAVIQYLNFVKVLSTYIPRFMKKAMFCAWGFPLLIVTVVLIVNYEVYGEHQNYCWISFTAFSYALALPVGLLLTTNVVVFCLVVYTITCGKETILRCNQDEKQQALMRLRASVCIFFLLGLSWIFGLLAVGEAKLVFQYLFTLTTTLQGFLIFIFCVIQEKTAREMWKKYLFPSVGHAGKTQTTHSTGDVSMSHVSKGKHT